MCAAASSRRRHWSPPPCTKDPDHHRCVELFTGLRLANRQMVLPAPVVAEIGYLLGMRADAKTEAEPPPAPLEKPPR
jgi:hypothetical protein